jgi:hypothetical protein
MAGRFLPSVFISVHSRFPTEVTNPQEACHHKLGLTVDKPPTYERIEGSIGSEDTLRLGCAELGGSKRLELSRFCSAGRGEGLVSLSRKRDSQSLLAPSLHIAMGDRREGRLQVIDRRLNNGRR